MSAPGFTGCGLDRADHLRLDQARLAEAAAHHGARLLGLASLDPLVDEAGRLQWAALNGAAVETGLRRGSSTALRSISSG